MDFQYIIAAIIDNWHRRSRASILCLSIAVYLLTSSRLGWWWTYARITNQSSVQSDDIWNSACGLHYIGVALLNGCQNERLVYRCDSAGRLLRMSTWMTSSGNDIVRVRRPSTVHRQTNWQSHEVYDTITEDPRDRYHSHYLSGFRSQAGHCYTSWKVIEFGVHTQHSVLMIHRMADTSQCFCHKVHTFALFDGK